jgi:hypothetical protein
MSGTRRRETNTQELADDEAAWTPRTSRFTYESTNLHRWQRWRARCTDGGAGGLLMHFATVVERVRSDFTEMPCLELTLAQAVRLWHVGADDCRSYSMRWSTRDCCDGPLSAQSCAPTTIPT